MTLRHKFLLLTIAILTALLTACSGNGAPYFIDDEPEVPIPMPEVKYLRTSVNSLSFKEKAESQTFNVSSNTNWEISCDANWVTISEGTTMHGSGNETIRVSVQPNDGTKTRTATITISSTETNSIQISITQTGLTMPSEGDNQTPQSARQL